jgi:Txe/YoeB family toxin of Txe-Axe toxin-antitoxin module
LFGTFGCSRFKFVKNLDIRKPSKVTFADEKIEKIFLELKETDEIKKFIYRAIEDVKQNAFCGIQIPKRLIPKEYIQKYSVTNLWKYDLPDGWRLVYSITTPDKVEIITLILEWFNHPEYERKFHY